LFIYNNFCDFSNLYVCNAKNPANNWAITYGNKSYIGCFPPITIITVTAGLKLPPDVFPKNNITNANVKPIAQAFPVQTITNRKIYVPKNS